MAMKKIFAAIVFLFLSGVGLTSTAAAQQAAKSSDETENAQVLREILTELKQLRSTLAKTGVNQMRFQTTFELYKAQRSRVDMLNRELDSIKTQLMTGNPNRYNADEMIKQTEERMAQTADPRQRQNFERQIQSIKRNVELQNQREKRLKDRQTTLEFEIPGEQGKLELLNSEIETIKQDINALLNQ